MLFAIAGTFAMAQVTFNPGLRTGVNFAKLSKGSNNIIYGSSWYNSSPVTSDYTIKTKADFYAGFQANIRFSKLYALQPEINYSRQGAEINYKENGQNKTTNFNVSYVGMGLVNKFYMDRFNVNIAPFLDIQLDSNKDVDVPFDFGIQLGAGYDITDNIGVEARFKRGIIPIISEDANHNNVVISAGAYFTFPVGK